MPPHNRRRPASGSGHQRRAARRSTSSSGASHATAAQPPHPIEVLPAEVLAEVFHWAAESPYLYDSHESRSSPSNIAGVCRHWRELAISTPTLWSNFSQNHLMGTKRIFLDKIQTYLQKSKDAPLNVYVLIGEYVPGLHELLVLINRNRHRCVVINLLIPGQARLPQDFLNLADMPRVEKIALWVRRWRGELDLSNAHCLTTLYHSHYQRFELRLGETPLHNLKNIELGTSDYTTRGGFRLADCMALLQATPELETLSMMIYRTHDWDDPVEESHPVIHLPKLTKLELFHERRNTVDDLKFVLKRLMAPNLTKVDVGTLEELTDNDDCGITDFLEKNAAKRSPPTLHVKYSVRP